MEIQVAPPPPAPPKGARLLVVLAICLPVTVLALLPWCFSLDRYVVTGPEMDPDLARGTLLVERSIPVSDLRVGDLVTYRVPHADGTRTVTRRVLALHDGQVATGTDAAPAPDPWTLDQRYATVRRVVVAVPWVGYGYLVVGSLGAVGGAGLVLLGAALLTLATAPVRRRRRRGRQAFVTAGS